MDDNEVFDLNVKLCVTMTEKYHGKFYLVSYKCFSGVLTSHYRSANR